LAPSGLVPWEQQTMQFTANATSETLTFLSDTSVGTNTAPPFVFLDGVRLVPEPASVGLMGLGIMTVGALRRRRARRATKSPVSAAA
jgi:hypothetical protein